MWKTVIAALCWSALFAAGIGARANEPLEYNRDVRPILAEHCFACHGPDSAARKADLRLDQREAAIDFGTLVPGDPDESEMIRRVLTDDGDEIMPPPEIKKPLTAAQREVLVRWVREGAPYQLHWSFLPPQRPSVPDMAALAASLGGERAAQATAYADWPVNSIDNFVLARLLTSQLKPTDRADRHALLRRVCLDLTGLPPSMDIIESYLNDTSPDAYENLVDRLLESKDWGEHRGRYWLDYARYADTHGVHFDNFREMWSYREWVIHAFNENMPFDQFTIENLAGDLLPDATLDQRIGSGFHRCNMTTNEGGIIDEEYRVLYARDRTETTAQVWLGLTANCAVCHSHKFDPLSQREFYEMAAFFNNTTQGVRDGNVKDTPPIVVVPQQEDLQRWASLPALISEAKAQVEQRRQAARSDFSAWLATATPDSLGETVPHDKLSLHVPLDEGQGRTVLATIDGEEQEVALTEAAAWQDGLSGKALQTQGAACILSDVGDFEADQAFTTAAWVRLAPNDSQGAICARMDNANEYRGWDLWNQRRQIGTHIISDWPEKGLKVIGRAQVPANQWVHVAVSYDGSGKAAGVRIYYDGKPQQNQVENDKLTESIRTDVPFQIGQRSTGEPFSGGIQDLRIYRRVLTAAEVESLARLSRYAETLAKADDQRTEQERKDLYAFWLEAFDEPYQTLSRQSAQLEQEQNAIKARGTIAHVMQEKGEPAMAYVLYRGEYDQRRDEVTPDTPDVLPGFPDEFPRNRLGFARWLLLPDHPLTARVTVNRFWQEVFGTGIVKTAGDFGVSGQLPSHPELLDWLAVEFRESGWDVKQLFKMFVMSATYRQSAAATAEKHSLDPENRLLARGPRFRMDAEMVRDAALASSGLLVNKIGGPSVKPYQPPGVWEAIAMNVSNTRSYQPDTGENLYRRSLYTFVKRMAPPASLEIFNLPNREYCVVQRERTNTPLQALVTLNDEQFIEAARHLAQIALRDGGDTDSDRLRLIGLRLVAREFRPDERAAIRESLDSLLAFYQQHPDDSQQLLAVGESPADPTLDGSTLAAWTMLCNQLMNLDEVLNK